MAGTKELVVPDLGDFDDVEVIEILVAPGDTVAVEDSLITLETDKATMEVEADGSGLSRSRARPCCWDSVSPASAQW